jgi:hypothetical protein
MQSQPEDRSGCHVFSFGYGKQHSSNRLRCNMDGQALTKKSFWREHRGNRFFASLRFEIFAAF